MSARIPRKVASENTYHLSNLNNVVTDNLIELNNTTSTLTTDVAKEAKQDTMIGLLEGQTPALNRTQAIPVQIMVGDAGANYDALRANGQDLAVYIDDINPDVAVNSGLSTSAKQDTMITSLATIAGDTTSIDGKITACDTGNVTISSSALPSGASTEAQQTATQFLLGLLATKAEQLDQGTSLDNIDNSTANIDGKIAKSVVVGSDGTTSAQVVMACGSNDGTNLRTIATNDTGDVRSLLIGTDNGGTTHEIQTSNSGVLITEVEHSWDTETIENATPLAGGGTALTTGTLDIGQGISHEMTEAIFYITNSANQSIDVQPQSSYNGTDWFVSAAGTSVTTTQNKSFMCQNECFKFGMSPRYMRLRVVNNGVSSTNITVTVGRYK